MNKELPLNLSEVVLDALEQTLCDTCSKIIIPQTESAWSYGIGTVPSIKKASSNGCRFCKLVIVAFDDTFETKDKLYEKYEDFEQSEDQIIYLFKREGPSLELSLKVGKDGQSDAEFKGRGKTRASIHYADIEHSNLISRPKHTHG
jgi:hypothetical protein